MLSRCFALLAVAMLLFTGSGVLVSSAQELRNLDVLTEAPSTAPASAVSTGGPSQAPTSSKPSHMPSTTPITSKPSRTPSKAPVTSLPSKSPSTSAPSRTPSRSPQTSKPSSAPSVAPSVSRPSSAPSRTPTSSKPSRSPSAVPTTSKPSGSPSKTPTTAKPSRAPSRAPSTSNPSGSPSKTPTTARPSKTPSMNPTTAKPSAVPSKAPTTSKPSKSPTKTPTTSRPSDAPTRKPTRDPTKKPTLAPTNAPSTSPTPHPRPTNVLLIIIDDLKPVLSAYDAPEVAPDGTPGMDRIVKRGVSFMNAHTQMAICGPSRASFLTSRRPNALGIFSLTANILQSRIAASVRKKKEILTIPKLFKLAGYNTYGIGKIFHENEFTLMARGDTWTVPVFTWINKFKRAPSFTKPYVGTWINSPDVNDTFFADGQAATMAADLITDVLSKDYMENDKPWFLAVGLWKPHVPWAAPKQYFDKCGPSTSYQGPYNTPPPKGLNLQQASFARGSGCGEAHPYNGPNVLSLAKASASALQQANRAYHATALYMDNQLNLILDALDNSPSSDNTIVVFISDHGFHLGDKGLYCKKTNYEQATKVPFIISAPMNWGAKGMRNRRSYAPVELLDLMPTLYDMAGLTIDQTKYMPWMGVSLMPIIRDPENGFVKSAAISVYPRGSGSGKVFGFSMRTVRYRYTMWGKRFQELYDYAQDPFETVSLQNTNKALRQSINSNAYRAGNFQSGIGIEPFDLDQRSTMRSLPPPSKP